MNDRDRQSQSDSIKRDPALWKAEAWASYAQVSGEAERIKDQPDATAKIAVVRRHLDDALEAMAPPRDLEDDRKALVIWITGLARRLKLYYSGGYIQKTWSAIHNASAELYTAYAKSELAAQAMRLRGLVAALPNLEWQLATLSEVINELEDKDKKSRPSMPLVRAKLRQIHLDAMDASESLQVEARTLRNTLLVASGALLAVVFAFGFLHVVNSCIIKICTVNTHGGAVCPGGGSSHGLDVFIVELAGVLGGILSVVIPLATGERIKTPYRVFNHQLLLKVLAGAATALAGVLLVQSHV